MSEPDARPGTDRFLAGRLSVRQPAKGHRIGTDAILLAAAAPVGPGDRFVDVGAGVGLVGLALATREPLCGGTLVEIDPETAALARENAAANGLDGRVTVICGDLFEPASWLGQGLRREAADLVVTNPPFFEGREARMSGEPARARAHHLAAASPGRTHGDWLRAALALLAPKGRFHCIHRPEALPGLLAAVEGRLGAVTIVPVHPRAGEDAIRLLLSGIKGSRAPLRLLPPLVLHGPDGQFTPPVEAAARGEALALP